jgi:hypothetical protein
VERSNKVNKVRGVEGQFGATKVKKLKIRFLGN